ncbi:MAG: phosphopantetheine adenylyltransferase [Candidatus Odinarchaeum yellowstonii]|jgi:pantetheine-phosphate adenylyltransferase|uniref:Phosphopantetheine adenylyltransferase n=1 Tax=Odinarchaeota yellowstonii (strain LCB_4) TaxID=1841599 RepID=A0AAF0D2W6_ODILC|nr:MAG: phosphopantetheine adenylyltransferase [Candidatus Odinarchaeum yellowstonii]
MSVPPQTSKKYKLVAVGGTFDHFHKGHESLLTKAFSIGERILIGVTTDSFCASKPLSNVIQPFELRKRSVINFIREHFKDVDFQIIDLSDKYGPTVYEKNIEAIVVTEDTFKTALEINQIRVSRGLQPLEIVLVDMVLAYDGLPISSTRVRRGEITVDGEPAHLKK